MYDPSLSDHRIPSLADIGDMLRQAFKKLPEDEVERAMEKARCPKDDGVVHFTFEFGGSTAHCTFDPRKRSIEEYIQEAAPRMQRIFRKKLLLKGAESSDHDTHAMLLADLRGAISKHGRDAKAMVIIKAAGVSNKPGRAGLRELEAAGEYVGFARKKPDRYR